MKFDAATSQMPPDDKNKAVIQNFNAHGHASVVIYLDLESIIFPTTIVNKKLSTQTTEKQTTRFLFCYHGAWICRTRTK